MSSSETTGSLYDWRIGASTSLAEPLPAAYPGGPSYEAGARLFLSCLGEAGSFGRVGFIAPSPVALAMNLSYSAAREGDAIRKNIAFSTSTTSEDRVSSVKMESSGVLYDYFEKAMVSVFFAYQSLEAFCNDEIFRKAEEPIEWKRKNGSLMLTRREAERTLTTSEKLGTLLPKILNVPTLKGKAPWQRFRELEDVRDNVVHLKNQTVYSSPQNMENEKVLFTLLAHDLVTWPRIALQVLEHFIREPGFEWFDVLKRRVI